MRPFANSFKFRYGSSSAGFTLLELMITIGIAGIAAAFIVPNYTATVARSRQAEAKMRLSAAYAAEKSFYLEHGSYTLCLADIGVSADTTGHNYYAVGFLSTYLPSTCWPTANMDCNLLSRTGPACAAASVFSAANVKSSPLVATVPTDTDLGTNVAGVPVGSTSDIGSTNFTIRAAGHVSAVRATLDRWRINEQKQMQNYLLNAGDALGI